MSANIANNLYNNAYARDKISQVNMSGVGSMIKKINYIWNVCTAKGINLYIIRYNERGLRSNDERLSIVRLCYFLYLNFTIFFRKVV